MAAKRSGIHTVILPRENERDLQEIDPVVRQSLRFVTAESIETVLETALCAAEPRQERDSGEIITAFLPPEQADSSLRH